MRFSLKWILFAVVYVAVAAAAFSQGSWVYSDLLWTASLLAVVFAALLAFMGRGKGRVAAAGFVLASLAFVACVAFGRVTGSDVVPTSRWLTAAGYSPIYSIFTGSPASSAAGPFPYSPAFTGTLSLQAVPAASFYAPSSSTLPTQTTIATGIGPPPILADFGIYVRAANAVGMMLFGGLGALVGLLAFKRISQPSPT